MARTIVDFGQNPPAGNYDLLCGQPRLSEALAAACERAAERILAELITTNPRTALWQHFKRGLQEIIAAEVLPAAVVLLGESPRA